MSQILGSQGFFLRDYFCVKCYLWVVLVNYSNIVLIGTLLRMPFNWTFESALKCICFLFLIPSNSSTNFLKYLKLFASLLFLDVKQRAFPHIGEHSLRRSNQRFNDMMLNKALHLFFSQTWHLVSRLALTKFTI